MSRTELAKQAEIAIKQVALAKKERAALDRQKAREFRKNQRRQLSRALEKLEDILPETPINKAPQNEKPVEQSVELILPGHAGDTKIQNENAPGKSAEVILPGVPSSAVPQSEVTAEKRLDIGVPDTPPMGLLQSEAAPVGSAEKNAVTNATDATTNNTNRLGKIVYFGKRLVSGCLKGAAVAYGGIRTGASLASKAPVPIFSDPMVASVILVGAIGALGNAYLGNNEWVSELQDEERDAKFDRDMELSEQENDAILKLLDQTDQADKSPIKTETEQEKNSAPIPQPVAVAQTETAVSVVLKEAGASGDVAVGILPASPTGGVTLAATKPAEQVVLTVVSEPSVVVKIEKPASPLSGSVSLRSIKPEDTVGQSAGTDPLLVVKIDIPAGLAEGNADSGLPKTKSKNLKVSGAGNSYRVFSDRPSTPQHKGSTVKSKVDDKSPRDGSSHRAPKPKAQSNLYNKGADRLFTPTKRQQTLAAEPDHEISMSV
jgi:hypothetical protein